MAIKPILFNTDMVRAILEGRKTVTRRVIKPQPQMPLCYTFAGGYKKDIGKWGYPSETAHKQWGEKYKRPDSLTEEDLKMSWNPPYHTDDILYVRETWQYMYDLDGNDQIIEETGRYVYAADGSDVDTWVNPDGTHRFGIPWRPSIHMPKEAARIWLKVTDVRMERLHEITEDGALREGAQGIRCDHAGLGVYGCTDCMNTGWIEPPQVEFMYIWDSTVKKSDLDRHGWDANPWVWVIEFERCEKPKGV